MAVAILGCSLTSSCCDGSDCKNEVKTAVLEAKLPFVGKVDALKTSLHLKDSLNAIVEEWLRRTSTDLNLRNNRIVRLESDLMRLRDRLATVERISRWRKEQEKVAQVLLTDQTTFVGEPPLEDSDTLTTEELNALDEL